MMFGIKKKDYIRNLIFASSVMVLFYSSYYWPDNNITKRKILEWIIIAFGIIVVPVLLSLCKKFNNRVNSAITDMKKYIVSNPVMITLNVVIFVAIIPLSYCIELLLEKCIFHGEFNSIRFFVVLAFNMILYLIILLRNCFKEHMEWLYGIVAIILGSTIIISTPARVGITWDDQIHYSRVLTIANSFNGIAYEADQKNIYEVVENTEARVGFDKKSRTEYNNTMNEMYDSGKLVEYMPENGGTSMIGYVPGAVGVIVGRGLNLSYTGVFNLGRFFNLLSYVLVIMLSIKVIKYGKLLVASIGMIPTLLFMASSYSYDAWLNSWCILGIAYTITAIYGEEQNNVRKHLIKGVLCIMSGCFVKAIYFPLVLIPIGVAIWKIKDKKIKTIIILSSFAAGLLLVLSFLVPMLTTSANLTDYRGGEGVNGSAQIAYILHNPLEYAGTLLRFLKSYLAIENTSYLQWYAYVGESSYWGMILIIIVVSAFIDRNPKKTNIVFVRVVGILMVTACLILVPTALYVAFTAVGSDVILGCQYRYILPTMLPILYFVIPEGIQVKYNLNKTAIVMMIIMSLIILNSMNELCANIYMI